MRYYVILVTLIALFFGCKDSLVNSESSNRIENKQKSWISLPKNSGLSIEEDYSASKIINGETGGSVKLSLHYKSHDADEVDINAEIKVPAGAYSGDKNITMVINSQNGSTIFYPNPEVFNKPLNFSLTIKGIDLTGIERNSLEFVYLAPDGSFIPVDSKKTKNTDDALSINDAVIQHFSSYGWLR